MERGGAGPQPGRGLAPRGGGGSLERGGGEPQHGGGLGPRRARQAYERDGASRSRRRGEPVNLDRALHDFRDLVRGPEIDLACAALAVARIEYPDLPPSGSLAALDDLAARSAVSRAGGGRRALDRLCEFLFDGEGFRGNAEDYYDPRNSCLNDVLDRRLGIPITLAVVAMEVGRRVGLEILGVGLPGHFCVGARIGGELVVPDPVGGGRGLERAQTEAIAARAVGRPGKLTHAHLAPTPKAQIVVRMLRN